MHRAGVTTLRGDTRSGAAAELGSDCELSAVFGPSEPLPGHETATGAGFRALSSAPNFLCGGSVLWFPLYLKLIYL